MTFACETAEAILTAKFGVPPERMDTKAVLASLDLDSLAVIELLHVLGRELDIRIGEDEVTPRHTVGQLVAVAEQKLARRATGPRP
ncbi:acyl carrier protein [Streptomyces sp. AV19]|uniref:acyl carrier protein n=1 Tax=Streptomyces sp. AV19 TaxID=2793068 RepID=UPI0018FF0900|nr:acyl carrier protein [Streptomyces sp. AV19]MBH1937494.1 acyl carrier protein [Streptomyces sp. AV19]MDG4533730.1 acyl carrier protein [Streptomyces sp. AV19]